MELSSNHSGAMLRAIPFSSGGADWRQKIKMCGGHSRKNKMWGVSGRGVTKNMTEGSPKKNKCMWGASKISSPSRPEDFKWNSLISDLCFYMALPW